MHIFGLMPFSYWCAGNGAAMSADDLAAALAMRIGPILAQSVPDSRLRIMSKGGHLNIRQDEQTGQRAAASKGHEGRASREAPATSANSRAAADGQGAGVCEPGVLKSPCQPSTAHAKQQEGLPSSSAGADGGRASTGNRGPEAGPGPQTLRSAARCKADLPGTTCDSQEPSM